MPAPPRRRRRLFPTAIILLVPLIAGTVLLQFALHGNLNLSERDVVLLPRLDNFIHQSEHAQVDISPSTRRHNHSDTARSAILVGAPTITTRNHNLNSSDALSDGSNVTNTSRSEPPPPLSFGACCGIGHRLERNIKTLIHALLHNRTAYAHWPDVPWDHFFHDTPLVKAARSRKKEREFYGNGQPKYWWVGPNEASSKEISPLKLTLEPDETTTIYDRYVHQLLEMPEAQEVAKLLRRALSEEVISFLKPLRSQYASAVTSNGLHLCVHVRAGNNERGAWDKPSQRREIHVDKVLNGTLDAMLKFVSNIVEKKHQEGYATTTSTTSSNVTVFVASDSDAVRPWFQQRIPSSWRILSSGKELKKPESGVWFGEHGSNTGGALTQSMRNAAMAEAVGECAGTGEFGKPERTYLNCTRN